jgi:hypothetical protein
MHLPVFCQLFVVSIILRPLYFICIYIDSDVLSETKTADTSVPGKEYYTRQISALQKHVI